MRECCKGDDKRLWERGKFDPRHPKTPKPMVTKICVGNYVGDIYHHAKFYPNRFRGFGSAHAWFRAPRHKVIRLFFWFLRKATAETRAQILTQNTSNDAVPRKEVPFGVAKPKSNVSTPIFPKKPPFLAPFRRDRIFSPKNGSNTLDGSRVNDP